MYVEVYITQSPWRAHHTPISLQARVQCTSRVPQTGPAAFAGPAHQGLACRARPNTGRTGGSLRPVQDLYEPHRVGPGQSDADDAASDRQGFWSRYPGAVRRTRRARTSAGCGGGTPAVSRKSVSITGPRRIADALLGAFRCPRACSGLPEQSVRHCASGKLNDASLGARQEHRTTTVPRFPPASTAWCAWTISDNSKVFDTVVTSPTENLKSYKASTWLQEVPRTCRRS